MIEIVIGISLVIISVAFKLFRVLKSRRRAAPAQSLEHVDPYKADAPPNVCELTCYGCNKRFCLEFLEFIDLPVKDPRAVSIIEGHLRRSFTGKSMNPSIPVVGLPSYVLAIGDETPITTAGKGSIQMGGPSDDLT